MSLCIINYFVDVFAGTYNQICNRKRVCSKTETCLFKNTMDTNGTCQCLPNLEYNYHTGCVSPSSGSAKGLPDGK